MAEIKNNLTAAQLAIQDRISRYLKHLDNIGSGKSEYNAEEISLLSDFDANKNGKIDQVETTKIKNQLSYYRDNISQFYDASGKKLNNDYDFNQDGKKTSKELDALKMILDSKKLDAIEAQDKKSIETKTKATAINLSLELAITSQAIQRTVNYILCLEAEMDALLKSNENDTQINELMNLRRVNLAQTQATLGALRSKEAHLKDDISYEKIIRKDLNELAKG